MKSFAQWAVISALGAWMMGGIPQALAQMDQQGPGNRRNFDPAQMQQRRLEMIRERFEVTDEAEWKLIQERVQKVLTAQQAARSGGMGGMGGMGRRGGGPGGDQGGGPQGDNNQRRMNMPGMEPNPELEALQQAIENKASKEEIKDKLTKLRESRKAKDAALLKAQEDLQKVLSSRQEAQAVVMGLLK